MPPTPYACNGVIVIHTLAAVTAVLLGAWPLRARKGYRAHRVKAHRINMTALYLGPLIITGLFTLLPGRLIGRMVWG